MLEQRYQTKLRHDCLWRRKSTDKLALPEHDKSHALNKSSAAAKISTEIPPNSGKKLGRSEG